MKKELRFTQIAAAGSLGGVRLFALRSDGKIFYLNRGSYEWKELTGSQTQDKIKNNNPVYSATYHLVPSFGDR